MPDMNIGTSRESYHKMGDFACMLMAVSISP